MSNKEAAEAAATAAAALAALEEAANTLERIAHQLTSQATMIAPELVRRAVRCRAARAEIIEATKDPAASATHLPRSGVRVNGLDPRD